MFKPIEEVTVTKFETDHHGFIVEIEESKKNFTAYLYHERYKVKMFMLLRNKTRTCFRDFVNMVKPFVDCFVAEYDDYYQGDKLGYDYDLEMFTDIETVSDYYNYELPKYEEV